MVSQESKVNASAERTEMDEVSERPLHGVTKCGRLTHQIALYHGGMLITCLKLTVKNELPRPSQIAERLMHDQGIY